MKSQILVGSISQSCGKTIFSAGLLRLLKRQNLTGQAFKSGSDFIDTKLLSYASGKPSYHLDAWVTSKSHIQRLYNKYGDCADVCITEGHSGLFDGYDRLTGSSATIAMRLKLPVLLIVNATGASYSVAASIFGFKHFYSSIRIVGVVFNQVVSSEQHTFLRRCCNDAGVECLGYIPFDEKLKIPSKHHCYTNKEWNDLNATFELAADYISRYVEVDKLLSITQRNFPVEYTLPYNEEIDVESLSLRKKLTIAVADDPAFGLTYTENLTHLNKFGTILKFSPVFGNDLPKADIVYLPGGYPELFARQLHRRKRMLDDLKTFAEEGGKILAEDGGMVLLGRTLSIREGGTAYEMAGVFPIDVTMNGPKICSGYRQMNAEHFHLRGYEFHYTTCNHYPEREIVCKTGNTYDIDVNSPLLRYKNVIATYSHLYLGETDFFGLWDNIK
ncbi:cobyrinate a,c-diamide synthase [Phocaeicola oris]|uniref:cobyrinate a,c-diamide synthase n=1 Tax=Phocaeicola oris TaxID=2896850 RepID=UPI00234F7317|nr:cobyrinate a,c-diamide synthase [Phocaeicola oris]MCE2615421.1 cobyrinate a,c-diamide synthase [Phocaeicola oris]